MKFEFPLLRTFTFGVILRTFLLTLALVGTVLLFSRNEWSYGVCTGFLVLIFAYNLIRYAGALNRELGDFTESVQYRDFSRNFSEKRGPAILRQMHRTFNVVNHTFRRLSFEKEAQYQYLQNILELVDTGILSFDEEGEVAWMNESLKRMLQIPYLKSLEGLQRRDPALAEALREIKPGETHIHRIELGRAPFKVLLSASAIQTEGKLFRLVAFQNVNEALDETEAQAWQKVLRVLTHEIMNSVAPISSLADTLQRRIHHEDEARSILADLDLGLETIRRRSQSLLRFAETYRNLNKIAAPVRVHVLVRDLFESLHQLMSPSLEPRGIELEIVLKDPHIAIEADIHLIEQVLINLILNAAEAIKEKEQPRIVLSAYLSETQRPVLEVTDNGAGIPADLLEKIFIPFFSTRKNGNGIGLSLARQIMLLHKGNIQVRSVEGEGSRFMLSF